MAFTETERSQIRFYLGLPDQYRDLNTVLEGQLHGDLSPQAEVIARDILTDLNAVDLALIDARKRLKALEVGSIKLPAGGELMELRSEGRRLCHRLASIFGVEVVEDVYSSSSGGSMGGVIPLG